jgi:RimJ/RimL family protein N-acetyltransferase
MASIFLRALEITDLERVHKWHNDFTLYANMVGPFRYVSYFAEEKWLQKKAAFSNTEINLAICLKKNQVHIGNIYVRDIDWIAKNCYFSGCLIGESEQRGKGYATEALKLMLNHCFQDLGLKRIWTYILENHDAAIRLNEKCGFIIEGTLRNHAFKHGEYKNVLIMGLCADDISKDKRKS